MTAAARRAWNTREVDQAEVDVQQVLDGRHTPRGPGQMYDAATPSL